LSSPLLFQFSSASPTLSIAAEGIHRILEMPQVSEWVLRLIVRAMASTAWKIVKNRN
jgi:hypothetical protein